MKQPYTPPMLEPQPQFVLLTGASFVIGNTLLEPLEPLELAGEP